MGAGGMCRGCVGGCAGNVCGCARCVGYEVGGVARTVGIESKPCLHRSAQQVSPSWASS